MFAGVRKSGMQGCSVKEKGSVSQNITGAWDKNVSKNYRVKRKRKHFLKTKKVLLRICNISHLLSCKLPHKFISWGSRKTKMPNCIVFLQYQSSWRQPEALPLLVINLELERTQSFCKYGLVLSLSLVYLVFCSVSVVIF